MPLILCTCFFAALFIAEAAWHWAGVAAKESELRRFEANEHPRRLTSDLYLDILG